MVQERKNHARGHAGITDGEQMDKPDTSPLPLCRHAGLLLRGKLKPRGGCARCWTASEGRDGAGELALQLAATRAEPRSHFQS